MTFVRLSLFNKNCRIFGARDGHAGTVSIHIFVVMSANLAMKSSEKTVVLQTSSRKKFAKLWILLFIAPASAATVPAEVTVQDSEMSHEPCSGTSLQQHT